MRAGLHARATRQDAATIGDLMGLRRARAVPRSGRRESRNGAGFRRSGGRAGVRPSNVPFEGRTELERTGSASQHKNENAVAVLKAAGAR
jgi:hypothetical protein